MTIVPGSRNILLLTHHHDMGSLKMFVAKVIAEWPKEKRPVPTLLNKKTMNPFLVGFSQVFARGLYICLKVCAISLLFSTFIFQDPDGPGPAVSAQNPTLTSYVFMLRQLLCLSIIIFYATDVDVAML